MDEYLRRSRDQPRQPQPPSNSEEESRFLPIAEERILEGISARAPLPELLNRICSALDCQIGNVVSLISLTAHNANDFAAIGMNAAVFGLYTFYSESIGAGNDELIGSLEMYCSIPQSPSAGELQLIERAKSLAVIAIKLANEGCQQGHNSQDVDRPVRGRVLEWPTSME